MMQRSDTFLCIVFSHSVDLWRSIVSSSLYSTPLTSGRTVAIADLCQERPRERAYRAGRIDGAEGPEAMTFEAPEARSGQWRDNGAGAALPLTARTARWKVDLEEKRAAIAPQRLGRGSFES